MNLCAPEKQGKTHCHRCRNCGTTWRHTPPFSSRVEAVEAHKCPECGRKEFWHAPCDPSEPRPEDELKALLAEELLHRIFGFGGA